MCTLLMHIFVPNLVLMVQPHPSFAAARVAGYSTKGRVHSEIIFHWWKSIRILLKNNNSSIYSSYSYY